MSGLTDAAKKAQREYMREWRKKNPEKVRRIKERYWEKKGKQMQEKEEGEYASEEV